MLSRLSLHIISVYVTIIIQKEVMKLRDSEQGTLELEGKVWGGNYVNTILIDREAPPITSG